MVVLSCPVPSNDIITQLTANNEGIADKLGVVFLFVEDESLLPEKALTGLASAHPQLLLLPCVIAADDFPTT